LLAANSPAIDLLLKGPGMPVLRLKPHLAAHVVSPEEVALLGESGRFALRGKVYAAVVPLLDGKRSDDAIVARLRGRIAPELVYYALGELEAKGYAAPTGSPSTDPASDAWWSGRGVATPVSSARLVDAGAHRPALAALRRALGTGRSTRRDATRDLVVVATGDYLDERIEKSIRAALPGACHVLPVRLAGATIWIGPLLDAKTAGLFKVLLRRLKANRPADVAARTRGAGFPLLPVQGLPATFDLAGAWIASAVSAIAAGTPPPALEHGVITLDPWTLETARHSLSISVGTAKRDPGAEIVLSAAPKRFTADGGHRTCPPQETLARLERVVSPITGIVPDVTKMPMPGGDIHVYHCMQVYEGIRFNPRANRVLGRPGGAAGKGASDLQARVSCLAEAVERYSCGLQGNEKRRRGRLSEIDEPAIDPRDLLLFSDAQYSDRDASNRVHGRGFNWVPVRFDPGRSIDWSPAWSLTHRRRVWLPTAFCYYGYRTPRDHEFCHGDSNGCAAGNTLEEAIQQGFFELVERDACALWWYNRARRPGIDLASFDDPFFAAMTAAHAVAGRDLVALDITSDLGIPAVIAVSWRRRDGGRIHFGLGCHLEPRLAVSRALAELNQGMAPEFSKPGKDGAGAIDGAHARWLEEATIANQPYLQPTAGLQRLASDFVDRSTSDVRDDLLASVELLRGKGLEMIVLDHTRSDLGFPVARVVVPGLRHFWGRYAPGRLYDVPVERGWVERPLAESELNPIPYFL
jgi:ribosomal protein S12 methylthiotransferase accessory factor